MKKTDIAPEMLENIKKEFENSIKKDGIITSFRKQIKEGKADYTALHNTASSVGENLAKAFNKYISPETLPNEKMHLNIAQKVLTPMFEEDYEIIATLGTELQKSLNKNVGLNLKGIKPDINKSRIDGIVTKISSYDNYKQGAWLLGEPCINYSQSVVDDVVRTNAEFHAKAGIRATIERTPVGEPCKYCTALAGRYTYPNVPDDVYRRHRSCRCLVTYNPGDGKRQNVHTKKWEDPKSSEKIAVRKAASKPISVAKTKEKVKSNLEKLKTTKTTKERVKENLELLKKKSENIETNTKNDIMKEGLQKQLAYTRRGKEEFIPSNSKFTSAPITIAGAETNNKIREVKSLISKFGGEEKEWAKKVAKIESEKYIFDVHWYEKDGIQYKTKVKVRKEK